MSLKIRLSRTGAKKKLTYRIVLADSRSPRDGRFIKILGNYNPKTQPPDIKLNENDILEWIRKGAKPSNTVASILKTKGIIKKLDKPASE